MLHKHAVVEKVKWFVFVREKRSIPGDYVIIATGIFLQETSNLNFRSTEMDYFGALYKPMKPSNSLK